MKLQDKQTVLNSVESLVKSGSLTFDELKHAYNRASHSSRRHRASAVSTAMYVVGALVVSIGVAVLIGQNWDQLTTATRLLSTLGLGTVLMALSSALRMRGKDTADITLADSLTTIGVVAFTIGIGVTAYQMDIELTPGTSAVLALSAAAIYGLLYLSTLRSLILIFSSIALATLSAFLFVDWAVDGTAANFNWYALTAILVGFGHILLGRIFYTRAYVRHLTRMLYGFGSIFFLGGAFTLATDYLSWELLFIPLVILAVWMSIILRTRSILVVSTVFLTAYIFYMTDKYFSESIGWAGSLIATGALFIALSYAGRELSRRYIK